MSNILKLNSALSEWLFKIAASVLPQVTMPVDSPIGKFMYGFLGVDPAKYSLWNELGFLAEPAIEVFISPMVNKYLGELPDEQVKDVAMKFVESMRQEVDRKGSINLFGMQLQRDAIEDLKRIMIEKMGE